MTLNFPPVNRQSLTTTWIVIFSNIRGHKHGAASSKETRSSIPRIDCTKLRCLNQYPLCFCTSWHPQKLLAHFMSLNVSSLPAIHRRPRHIPETFSHLLLSKPDASMFRAVSFLLCEPPIWVFLFPTCPPLSRNTDPHAQHFILLFFTHLFRIRF